MPPPQRSAVGLRCPAPVTTLTTLLLRRKLEKSIDGVIVEKRFFKPPGGEYDPLAVPPEWSQWLHKTRQEVPSAQDIARCAVACEAERLGVWQPVTQRAALARAGNVLGEGQGQ